MPRQRLHQLLDELHNELEINAQLSESEKDDLKKLRDQVTEIVKDSPTQASPAEVSKETEKVEVEHIKVKEIVQKIGDTLSGMGI